MAPASVAVSPTAGSCRARSSRSATTPNCGPGWPVAVGTVTLVGAMRRKHALGAALSPDAHRSMAEQSYGPVIAAITELLEAGKRDGSIRADAEPVDFLQLTGALWRAAPDRSEPMLALILDGLGAQAETSPLSVD